MSAARWLTSAAKRHEVADWLTYRDSVEIPPNPGGRGYPDPIIFPWTDRINAIPHVCTLQSCSGHRTGNGDGSTHVYAGQLWLWLTEPAARAAYVRLPELAALPEVETARILMIDGQEILDVIFPGSETEDGLGTTLLPLIDWLGGLA